MAKPQIQINLETPQDLEFHLPNEIDPKTGRPLPHRKAAIGTDRKGKARLMSVIGQMPVAVHGLSTDGEPHTLVIFEWSAAPEIQGLRFKEVVIEVSFSAEGYSRRNAEDEAAELRRRGFNPNYWDPEVVAAVPTGTEWYHRTIRKVGGKSTLEMGFSAGFATFVSLAPKYAMERDTGVNLTDSIKVMGRPFVAGSNRNRPNAVRWTMLENESQKSGVPAYLRTAVLLKRQSDDNGIFLGRVSVETHVSWWEDLMEKKRKLTGDVPKNEPIVFDPDDQKSVGKTPFDGMKNKLDKVDLRKEFNIVMLEASPQGKEDEAEGAGHTGDMEDAGNGGGDEGGAEPDTESADTGAGDEVGE
ncbi:hypothetical protein B0H63DRAFT_533942 [Podospora didyma]|uniref:Uncharacterized protein n=1 Tax=Podospora didyma TaxID=330526 RepID=A0AAE0P8N0_9PEZI|nr:hypothetical protein B0H63DRAFT_533942 [Podospora didyma]